MFKLVLEKVEEPEIKLPTFTRSSVSVPEKNKQTKKKNKKKTQKSTSVSALLTITKPLTV